MVVAIIIFYFTASDHETPSIKNSKIDTSLTNHDSLHTRTSVPNRIIDKEKNHTKPTDINKIYEQIKSTDWHQRHIAIWNAYHLAKSGELNDISLFVQTLDDPDPRNRRAAVEIIGELKIFSQLELVKKALQDSDSFVRGAAAISLGKLKDRSSLTLLKHYSENKNLHPREKEQIFLARLMLADPEIDKEVMDQLANQGNPWIRAHAVELIGHSRRIWFVPKLVELLNDSTETGDVISGSDEKKGCQSHRVKVRDTVVEVLQKLTKKSFHYDIWASEQEQRKVLKKIKEQLLE